MSYFNTLNLTDRTVSSSFANFVQVTGSILTNGVGNSFFDLSQSMSQSLSSSHALVADSALISDFSTNAGFANSAGDASSATYAVVLGLDESYQIAYDIVGAKWNVPTPLTAPVVSGSLHGTSSWASRAVTSSYISGSTIRIINGTLQLYSPNDGFWYGVTIYGEAGTGSIELNKI